MLQMRAPFFFLFIFRRFIRLFACAHRNTSCVHCIFPVRKQHCRCGCRRLRCRSMRTVYTRRAKFNRSHLFFAYDLFFVYLCHLPQIVRYEFPVSVNRQNESLYFSACETACQIHLCASITARSVWCHAICVHLCALSLARSRACVSVFPIFSIHKFIFSSFLPFSCHSPSNVKCSVRHSHRTTDSDLTYAASV